MDDIIDFDLNHDGASESLYYYLWLKDEQEFRPKINIPDTITIKYGEPDHWYFTSSNGVLKRKSKNNVSAINILNSFSKFQLGFDVIALFIALDEPVDVDNNNAENKIFARIINYYDREGLRNFFDSKNRKLHGILQRFIEPKGAYNETLRCIWSPSICLVERGRNKHLLHDERYGMYERCITHDGPEYYYYNVAIRGEQRPAHLRLYCENIVNHIQKITLGQKNIIRMVLNFKIDSKDTLWFLFTSSIRCRNLHHSIQQKNDLKNTINLNDILHIPFSQNLSPNKHLLSPQKSYQSSSVVQSDYLNKQFLCLSCGKYTYDNIRHPVPYKTIVRHYEFTLKAFYGENRHDSAYLQSHWPPSVTQIQAIGNIGFGCIQKLHNLHEANGGKKRNGSSGAHHDYDQDSIKIAPLIRYNHSNLDYKHYNHHKKDPLFLFKSFQVCESCYLAYTEFSMMMLCVGENNLNSVLLTPIEKQSMASHQFSNTLNHSPIKKLNAKTTAVSPVKNVSPKKSMKNSSKLTKNTVLILKNSNSEVKYDSKDHPSAVLQPLTIIQSNDDDTDSYIDNYKMKLHQLTLNHTMKSSQSLSSLQYETGTAINHHQTFAPGSLQDIMRESEMKFLKHFYDMESS